VIYRIVYAAVSVITGYTLWPLMTMALGIEEVKTLLARFLRK